MDRKQSSFTQVSELEDSDFLPAFGSGTNKKISKSDFVDQLKNEAQVFIYPTVSQLQSANLAADPDWPIYVRVEETEYRLYKITSLVAGANDIPLDNGATATFQEEYSEIGFVVGPSPSVNGAVALFDGETGTQLKNGPVMGAIGENIASLDSAPDTSFIKINPDSSVSLRNTAQFRTDLSISNVDNTSDANKPISDATQNALDGKVSGPSSSVTDQVALFDGITGKLIKAGQTLADIFDGWLVQLYNIFPRTINTYADIVTTPMQVGQVVYLKQHTSGGIGGGEFIGVPSVGLTPDNGLISTTASAGVFAKRITDGILTPLMFGAIPNGLTSCSGAINNAISYLSSIGGGTLLFPTGKYLLDAPIELLDFIELLADRNAYLLQGVDDLELIRSVDHAYFSRVRGFTFDGNGFDGGVACAFNNFRLNAGVFDCFLTDIEGGIYFLGGCFGSNIDNLTSYDGCPNPIVILENGATCVINNPNFDNVSGRYANTGYGVRVAGDGVPNEGVIINGGYIQGYIRGIWDSGRGTRIDGTYFEQCAEADVYFGGAIQSSAHRTQHFAAEGAAAFVARETDGVSVFEPNMGSGGRLALYDVDATNTNFVEYRKPSSTSDNTPVGSLTYISSLAQQTFIGFTPTVAGSTTAGAPSSYPVQEGRITRIGDEVTVNIDVAWVGHSGSGAIVINGIPNEYTPASFVPAKIGQAVLSGFAVAGPQVYVSFTQTAAQLRPVTIDAAGNAGLVTLPLDGAININFTYSLRA